MNSEKLSRIQRWKWDNQKRCKGLWIVGLLVVFIGATIGGANLALDSYLKVKFEGKNFHKCLNLYKNLKVGSDSLREIIFEP